MVMSNLSCAGLLFFLSKLSYTRDGRLAAVTWTTSYFRACSVIPNTHGLDEIGKNCEEV
jgi:hypothetical protein